MNIVVHQFILNMPRRTNGEGKLSAVSSFEEDIQLATENAVKMMSRGRIYHSSFNELKKWAAHTQLAENKKLKVANATTGSSRQDYIFYDDAQATSFKIIFSFFIVSVA